MTYLELLQAAQNESLMNRAKVACVVTAEAIGNEAPATVNNANRMKWAKEVFNNPAAAAVPMLWAVLAKNRALTLAAAIAVTDATLQTAVDSEVNTLAGVA
jgi:pyruvate/2-oxoacid:ferredoxin oxidoreductase beta subunit